jgi:hypothetical protein
MIIKAVIPSRGLIHSKTMRGVLNNISSSDVIILDPLPMPDCFNAHVQAALDKRADFVWFVEEDNECPDGVLDALLELDTDIATLDYTVGGNNSHIYERDGEILWCGLGCTLIRSYVFEAIDKPWFEVDKHLNFDGDEFKVLQLPEEKVPGAWAGHDSHFFYTKCRPKGFHIKKLEGWHGEHYRVKEIPKLERNHGHYTIYSL